MTSRSTPPATLCLTRGMRLPFAVSAVVWIAAMGGDPARGGNVPARVEFNRDVRPILSENCFLCHGPDKNRRKADLRLDVRDEALEAEAIVPGKPDESELVERILSDRPRRADAAAEVEQEARRPAEGDPQALGRAGGRISAALGVREAGQGTDPRRPERRRRAGPAPARRGRAEALARGRPPHPDPPAVVRPDRPAADARGGRGVRRATRSPDAYERLVDRLLASPHYGERMAIGWLDVVRFADTIGYHSDNPRNVWPYRD